MFLEQNRERKLKELVLKNERLTIEMEEIFTSFEPEEVVLREESLQLLEGIKKRIDEKIELIKKEPKIKTAPTLPQAHWMFVR